MHSSGSGADSRLWCRGEARPRRLHLIKARGRTSTFSCWLPNPYLLFPLKQLLLNPAFGVPGLGGSNTQRLWVKLWGQQGKAVLPEPLQEPLEGLKEKNNPCLLPAALSVSPLPNYYFCSPGASGAADAQKSPGVLCPWDAGTRSRHPKAAAAHPLGTPSVHKTGYTWHPRFPAAPCFLQLCLVHLQELILQENHPKRATP